MAKNLPGISSKLPSDVRQFLDRVREFISTTAADFVSRSELESAGVITTDAYGRTLAGAQNEVSQLSPPAPTGVTATGAMTNILVEWDEAAYPNHSYAEIWASGADDLGAAVMVGESTATMFAHAVGTGVTRYYWVRFVSTANVAGPFNAIAGVHGQTSNDPAWMLEVLTGQLSETQLVSELNTRIDLIDALPSVSGSVNARIAAETEARIAALAAEIEDRSVAISNEARQRIDDVQATAESVLRNAIALHNEASLRTGDVATARFELTENLQTGLLAEATARLTLEARVSNTEASVISEQTARADGDTANANSINSLYSQVNDPATGLPSAIAAINAEATSRAEGDLAESSARDILAAQLRGDYTGTDVAMLTSGLLYAEKLARATEDLALAQQITLLSAGAGEQFDWKSIWYFDSGIEGWDGNGAPTASAGWLRPADDGADPYATSPTGIGADGAKYSQMRLRIRKTGAPVWEGFLWWRAAADSTWDTSRRIALTEPTYDVHGIGLITVSPGWTVTVDRVRIDLSTAQSGTDYFEIDWVAIGRPSPGASSAQLLDEQTARANADSSEVSARQSLSAKLTGATDPSSLTLGTLASGLIFDERQARASADGAMSTLITQLRTDVDGNAADITIEQTARSDADSAEVTARQALSAKLTGTNDPSSLTLATLASGLIYDEKNARVTEDSALAYSLSVLSGQVSDNAGAILDEQTARADGDSATASDIRTLYATSRALSFADQQAAEAAIRSALAIDGQRGASDQTVAVLRTEMRTEFSEGISAEATARTLLAAAVDANTAAIQSEQTARADADGAMASDISALQITVSGHTAAISTEQTVRADADSAMASNISALQTTVSGHTAAISSEQTARADADSAMASDITTLQTTVSGHTTSITTQQGSIDGISALYLVKIDNNGVLSGFGLTSDLADGVTPTSRFIASVDEFAIIAPGRTAGQLNSVPFAVLTTAQTINGVTFEPGVYIDGASINVGSIGNLQIGSATIDDEKIINMSAAKITFGFMSGERIELGSLSANRLDTGDLQAGVEIRVGDRLKIHADGWIESYSSPGYSHSADYSRMDSGQFQLYRYVPSVGSVLYNYLSRIETGVAANGSTVTIPGYWKSQPKVIISPASLSIYNPAYATQGQSLDCRITDLVEVTPGGMVWKFTPVASLNLSAYTGLTILSLTSGEISSNSYTSATQTTSPNCTQITPSITIQSQRGNGASQYYLRTVRWRIEYLSGATWIPGSWRSVNMGAQFTAQTDSVSFTFPSQGTWQWRIVYEAFDTDGTVFGAINYTYGTYVVSSVGAGTGWQSGANQWQLFAGYGYGSSQSVTVALASNSAPAGAQIYQVVYSWTLTYSPYYSSSLDSFDGYIRDPLHTGLTHHLTYIGSSAPAATTVSESKTVATSSAPTSMGTFSISGTFGNTGAAWARFSKADVFATVYHRTIVANSVTPGNTYSLNNVSYTLSSSTVLAEGTVNWMATGE